MKFKKQENVDVELIKEAAEAISGGKELNMPNPSRGREFSLEDILATDMRLEKAVKIR